MAIPLARLRAVAWCVILVTMTLLSGCQAATPGGASPEGRRPAADDLNPEKWPGTPPD